METSSKKYSLDFNDNRINSLVLEAQSGNDEICEKLLTKFEPLIISIATKFLSYSDYEDIMQNGRMGFINAIKDFDSSRGSQFSSFAYNMITWEIEKNIRTEKFIKMPQGFWEFALKVKKIADSIETESGKIATDEEIYEILDDESFSIDKVDLARQAILQVISLDQPSSLNSDDERTVGDKYISSEHENQPEWNIIDYIETSGLTDREVYIVNMKHGFNSNQKKTKTIEIAKSLNVSESRIMQIYRKAIIKIKKHAESDGFLVKHR